MATTEKTVGVKKAISYSYEVTTGCGQLYVSFKYVDGKLQATMSMGKSGGCASSQIDALEKLVNLTLQHGVPLSSIKHSLSGISCHAPYLTVLSCADGIAKIVDEMMNIHENLEVE